MSEPASGLTVAACIIHFNTPDLLRAAVTTFVAHEPGVPLRVIDNGSDAASDDVLASCAAMPGVTVERLGRNVYHGPAMDHALRTLDADLVLFLDSDTETRTGGFVADMAARFAQNGRLYALGQLVNVDRRGFAGPRATIPVPHSAHVMVRRAAYLTLPPFVHHGLPVLANMRAAQAAGWKVHAFPIERYVWHKGRGTAARFGYGLGWRSRLDYLLHRLGL
ncbi:MAG TPA: glycosyltransferase [Rhodothermales bacterium]|nr:glycosyltransferase [Rhodothermales bacterium]